MEVLLKTGAILLMKAQEPMGSIELILLVVTIGDMVSTVQPFGCHNWRHGFNSPTFYKGYGQKMCYIARLILYCHINIFLFHFTPGGFWFN